MRIGVLLATFPTVLLLLGVQACGTTSTGHGPHADGGDDAAPSGDDSGVVPAGPCGWIGLQGLDASCAVGSDCRTGQVCLVAEGCFCSSEGRCVDEPCEGGLSSAGCAQSACRQALSGSADPDAGVISCFVSGC